MSSSSRVKIQVQVKISFKERERERERGRLGTSNQEHYNPTGHPPPITFLTSFTHIVLRKDLPLPSKTYHDLPWSSTTFLMTFLILHVSLKLHCVTPEWLKDDSRRTQVDSKMFIMEVICQALVQVQSKQRIAITANSSNHSELQWSQQTPAITTNSSDHNLYDNLYTTKLCRALKCVCWMLLWTPFYLELGKTVHI